MSDSVPLDVAVFAELEQLVHGLGEELASFRRRALQAEARLRSIEESTRTGDLFSEERLEKAERENVDLNARLEGAAEQTRQVLAQVRFLRQQQQHRGSEK